jgi:hypothetical protein
MMLWRRFSYTFWTLLYRALSSTGEGLYIVFDYLADRAAVHRENLLDDLGCYGDARLRDVWRYWRFPEPEPENEVGVHDEGWEEAYPRLAKQKRELSAGPRARGEED